MLLLPNDICVYFEPIRIIHTSLLCSVSHDIIISSLVVCCVFIFCCTAITSDLHGNIHQVLRHALICSFQVSYEMSREVLVLVSHQCVGSSLLAGVARPTNTVSMGVNISRDVVVDDCTNVWDVQTYKQPKSTVENSAV